MKYIVLAAGLALAACEQTGASGSGMSDASAADVQRISTMEQLRPLLDRRWELGDGKYVVVRSNGTLAGDVGQPVTGTWELRDGYWCRVLVIGSTGAPLDDCQVLQGEGESYTGIRKKGTGKTYSFTLGAAF